MTKKAKSNVNKNIIALKMCFILLYPIVLILIVLANLLILKGRGILLAVGAFFIVSSIIGLRFKIPLFNRQYSYKGGGFDDQFGLRDHVIYSSMLCAAFILILITYFYYQA